MVFCYVLLWFFHGIIYRDFLFSSGTLGSFSYKSVSNIRVSISKPQAWDLRTTPKKANSFMLLTTTPGRSAPYNGQDGETHESKYMKGWGNLSFRYLGPVNISNTLPYDCVNLVYWTQHENDRKTSCFGDLFRRRAFLSRFVKEVLSSNERYTKGVQFVNGRCTRIVSLLPKMAFIT